MADAFKVLVWEGEQSFLACVFFREQEGGRGERTSCLQGKGIKG